MTQKMTDIYHCSKEDGRPVLAIPLVDINVCAEIELLKVDVPPYMSRHEGCLAGTFIIHDRIPGIDWRLWGTMKTHVPLGHL